MFSFYFSVVTTTAITTPKIKFSSLPIQKPSKQYFFAFKAALFCLQSSTFLPSFSSKFLIEFYFSIQTLLVRIQTHTPHYFSYLFSFRFAHSSFRANKLQLLSNGCFPYFSLMRESLTLPTTGFFFLPVLRGGGGGGHIVLPLHKSC